MKISPIYAAKEFIITFVLFFNFYYHGMTQACNPDIESPFLSVKNNANIYLDLATQYNLKAYELVSYSIDNCTSRDKIRYSFSADINDNVKLIQKSSNFPIALTIFATDESGNSSNAPTQFTISKCSQSLACNDQVKFSINSGEKYQLLLDDLLEGNYCSDHNFEISYFDGNIYKPITYIEENLPRNFKYRVKDLLTGNSCWGDLSFDVKGQCDPNANFAFACSNISSNCFDQITPETIGFPFPATYVIETLPNATGYNVIYKSGCPKIKVVYSDQLVDKDCTQSVSAEIIRIWSAILPSGIIACTQLIALDRSMTKLYSNMHNYDDVDLPKLNCKDSWIRKDNFIPDPSVTGTPVLSQCKKLTYNYEDIVLIGNSDPCGTDYKIIRQWTVLSSCTSEVFKYNQIIKVYCGTDITPPVAICNQQTIISIPTSGEAEINASILNSSSYDNCQGIIFSFDKEGKIKTKKFTALDAGKIFQFPLFVTDLAGNQSSCIVEVEVSTKGLGSLKNIIGGVIRNYRLEPSNVTQGKIKYALLNGTTSLNLIDCGSPVAYPNLNYSLCIDSTNYVMSGRLDPRSNPDPLNGVSTFDIVQVIKRIFGIIKFNAYEELAADVDCDDQISILDIFDMRRLILGITTKFKCPSVEFYTADAVNPKLLKDQLFSNLPRFDVDFVPVRKGDINGNGFFFNKETNEVRSGEKFSFSIDNFPMKIGETYSVWIRTAEDYKIYGIQLGQLFDANKIEILDISSPYLNLTRNTDYAINAEGDWRCLLISPNLELLIVSGGFLKIQILAKANCMVNEALSGDHFPFPLFVIGTDVELSIPTITQKDIAVGTHTPSLDHSTINIYPNPFYSFIDIEMVVGQEGEANLEIYNTEGKQVYKDHLFLKSSRNRFTINAEKIIGSGVFLLVIKNKVSTYSKMLIKE